MQPVPAASRRAGVWLAPRLRFHAALPAPDALLRGTLAGVNAAALKQVPSCEFHPLEAVKTNVMGTENVLEAAIQCGVKRVVVGRNGKRIEAALAPASGGYPRDRAL